MILDSDGEQFIPDAIVVDGTSVLNLSVKQGLIEFSKKRANVKAERDKLLGEEKFVKVEGAGLELKDYNSINFKGQDLVLTLTGSGLHYIITARETDEKEQVKDSEGKITSIATGKKIPEGFKEMGYNVKTEMRLYRDEDEPEVVKAYVKKDRTHTYPNGSIVEDPSLFAFQTVIDKTKDHNEVVVQNRLHDAIKKELKETEKEVLGEETDTTITNENIEDLIKQVLDRMTELGSTPKSKQVTKIKLQEANLPIAPSGFKNTKDITILKRALEVLA
jgi:hypothetical protein